MLECEKISNDLSCKCDLHFSLDDQIRSAFCLLIFFSNNTNSSRKITFQTALIHLIIAIIKSLSTHTLDSINWRNIFGISLEFASVEIFTFHKQPKVNKFDQFKIAFHRNSDG